MIILGFDTSLAACSAAAYDAARGCLLASRYAAMERGHAEAIAPMLREVMEEAGLGFARIARIAVTVGPGAFTGVRIGLAMARGLGLALEVPVVAVGTLEAIACNATEGRPIAVACEARHGQFYFAMPPSPPEVLPLDEAVRRLPAGGLRLMGDGADRLIAAAGRGDLFRESAGDLPDAARFTPVFAAREPGSQPPEPVYLRPPGTRPAGRTHGLFTRPATAAESALLAALHGDCFEVPWSAADFARLLATPGALALIALEGDEPQGFILLRRAADEAEIITLGTRTQARRRGIAKRLIGDALGHLAGLRRVFIEVGSGNAAARALYAGLGFVPLGERKAYYEQPHGRREDAIVMRKELGR